MFPAPAIGEKLRVLVVEDEFKMAELLRRGLEEQRCCVEVAHTGHDGLRIARSSTFDVVTLDVMLPGIDGLEVARELRRFRVLTPILFLTARDSKLDIVRGLEVGGDDYLTKPFSFLELLARLRALARRNASVSPQKLQVENLVLDPATMSVTRGGVPGRFLARLRQVHRTRSIGHDRTRYQSRSRIPDGLRRGGGNRRFGGFTQIGNNGSVLTVNRDSERHLGTIGRRRRAGVEPLPKPSSGNHPQGRLSRPRLRGPRHPHSVFAEHRMDPTL